MRIVIDGDPIPKARHRSFIRHGHIATYDAQGSIMSKIMTQMHTSKKDWVHTDSPLKVDLIFQLDCEKGSSKAESILKQWSSHFNIFNAMATKKIDLDNLCKTYLDCGNGILWSDDRFIVHLSSRKVYSENPCTIINIETIKEVKMSDAHEKVFKTFSPQDMQAIIRDADRIGTGYPNFCIRNPELLKEQMTTTAQLLIEFADQWADKLKKIKGK